MGNEFLDIVNKTDRIIKFNGILVFYPNEPVKVSGKTKEQVPAIDILIKRGDFEIVGGANKLPKTAKTTEMHETHETHETAQALAETKRTHKTVRKGKKAKKVAKMAEETAKETEKEETAQADELPLGDSLNDPKNLL